MCICLGLIYQWIYFKHDQDNYSSFSNLAWFNVSGNFLFRVSGKDVDNPPATTAITPNNNTGACFPNMSRWNHTIRKDYISNWARVFSRIKFRNLPIERSEVRSLTRHDQTSMPNRIEIDVIPLGTFPPSKYILCWMMLWLEIC